MIYTVLYLWAGLSVTLCLRELDRRAMHGMALIWTALIWPALPICCLIAWVDDRK